METKKQTSIVVWVLMAFIIGFFCAGLSSFWLKQMVLSATFIGMTSAMLSFFLQFAYSEGHIFHGYYKWVERTFRDNPKNSFSYLANPLGLCPYCQNVWVVVGMFIAAFLWFDVSLWMFIPTTAISHFLLTMLDKAFWR